MTIDTLLSDFDAAVMRAQSMNREDLPAWAHRRSGLVAVVKALRDESYACDHGDEWLKMLDEILGSEGEKVAGSTPVSTGCLDSVKGEPPASPATDAAPAVCVWEWMPSGWCVSVCDDERLWMKVHKNCPSCGKPIKFTEGK